jgi:hypothetical protein
MNLSIIGNPDFDESIGQELTREERKAQRRQNIQSRIDTAKKDKPNKVKKVLLAIPRAAMTGLLLLNVRGMASRLNEMNKKDPAKVKAMWLRLGGDPAKLIENVEKGAKKKRILGEDVFSEPAIGLAIPAALASAAPIIVVIKKFLDENGIKAGAGESLEDIKPEPGTEIDTNTAAADAETPEAKAAQPTKVKTRASDATQPRVKTNAPSSSSGLNFSPTTGLLIGGALLAAFFLFKKKK